MEFDYEQLKEWQTGIGAFSGLIALMLAALVNSKLNRRRDAALRKEESLSIMAALYSEMTLLRDEVAHIGRTYALAVVAENSEHPIFGIDQRFIEAHQISEPLLYKSLASKIGFIKPELVLKIAEFYSNLEKVRKWLPQMRRDPKRGHSQWSDTNVLVPARNAVNDIVPTLNELKRILKISHPIPELDLGHLDSILNLNRQLWDELAATEPVDLSKHQPDSQPNQHYEPQA